MRLFYSPKALLQFLTLFSRFYNQAEIGANFNFSAYVKLHGSVLFPNDSERPRNILGSAAKQGFQP